jgi:hypothetical protein
MNEKVTSNTHTRARKTKPRIVRTEDLLTQIFERVANGESLNKICSEPGMPARKSFYEWVAQDETVLRRYEFAMTMRADTYAEQTIEISDDSRADKYIDENGREVTNHEVVNRARLRVDARKWYASKLAPKKYGDKVVNEHQGGDPDKPILSKIEISFVPGQKPQTA